MERSKTNEKTIEILNDLIKINNDRIEGYKKALKNTEPQEAELKTLYSRMISESYEYNREISESVIKLHGEPATDNTTPGKIYHAWMDVKATFSGHGNKSILAACEYGEDATQRAYAKALEKDSPMSTEIYDRIARQKSLLRGSHDLIRQYRDQYIEIAK